MDIIAKINFILNEYGRSKREADPEKYHRQKPKRYAGQSDADWAETLHTYRKINWSDKEYHRTGLGTDERLGKKLTKPRQKAYDKFLSRQSKKVKNERGK